MPKIWQHLGTKLTLRSSTGMSCGTHAVYCSVLWLSDAPDTNPKYTHPNLS